MILVYQLAIPCAFSFSCTQKHCHLAAECQDTIDSSANFRDTVTQGIRAAALFDENDDQREHVMPALAICYRCIGVVMQHVTAKEDALVSPYNLDYNSVTAQNVTSSAAGQSQALLYIALYMDNCLWDGKTRVLLDNIYASLSENIMTANSSSALVAPPVARHCVDQPWSCCPSTGSDIQHLSLPAVVHAYVPHCV